MQKNYYVYIVSNKGRTVFYIGLTNDLKERMKSHARDVAIKNTKSFVGRYNLKDLIYFETYNQVTEAIAREKQLKGWRRSKKKFLILEQNPKMLTLSP